MACCLRCFGARGRRIGPSTEAAGPCPISHVPLLCPQWSGSTRHWNFRCLGVAAVVRTIEISDPKAPPQGEARQCLRFRGLDALASYSFSHSIDSSSTDVFSTRLNTPASLADPNIDCGNSDYDVRHAFLEHGQVHPVRVARDFWKTSSTTT